MLILDWITLSVVSGVGFLAISLVPIVQLLRITRSRQLRRAWLWLAIMVVGFIVGYLLLAELLPRDTDVVLINLICVILVMGGVFVMSVAILALRTADDVARLVHLEREVVIDPLTGVYNRRYFSEQFEREFELALRTGVSLSLLVIDLDHFKKVNDTHGHAIGDRVLAVVAAILSERVRSSDIVVRYGGEEFVILARATSPEVAARLGERVLSAVRAMKVSCPGNCTLSITASVGVASQEPYDTRETLFDRADAALFEAKRSGRDRVVVGGGVCDDRSMRERRA